MKLVTVLAAREKVVGWYSTGPRLREADLDITELMTNYCDTPLLVICEVQVSRSLTLHCCKRVVDFLDASLMPIC